MPDPFSAARERIVTAGMTKRLISTGRYVNIWSIVARSISQKPPTAAPLTFMCGAIRKRAPRRSIVPPRTTYATGELNCARRSRRAMIMMFRMG